MLEHFARISLVARPLGKMNVLADEQVQESMRVEGRDRKL